MCLPHPATIPAHSRLPFTSSLLAYPLRPTPFGIVPHLPVKSPPSRVLLHPALFRIVPPILAPSRRFSHCLASLSHAFSHRPALDRHIAPFLRTSVSHPFSHRPALSRAIMPFLTLSRFTLACSPPLACLLTLSHFLPPASCRQPTHGMMSDTQI